MSLELGQTLPLKVSLFILELEWENFEPVDYSSDTCVGGASGRIVLYSTVGTIPWIFIRSLRRKDIWAVKWKPWWESVRIEYHFRRSTYHFRWPNKSELALNAGTRWVMLFFKGLGSWLIKNCTWIVCNSNNNCRGPAGESLSNLLHNLIKRLRWQPSPVVSIEWDNFTKSIIFTSNMLFPKKDGWEPLCKFLNKPIPKGNFRLLKFSKKIRF